MSGQLKPKSLGTAPQVPGGVAQDRSSAGVLTGANRIDWVGQLVYIASLRGAPRVISDGSCHRLPAAGLHGSDDCMLAELDEMPPVETGGADRHHC